MKTIKDLTAANINAIYSIIIGKEKTAGKIDWTPERDYVIAIFKVEDCIDKRFDTVEMGISINAELEIDHLWHYVKSGSVSISHEPLHNHHAITKYLIDEGFDVVLPSDLATLRSRVKELEEEKELIQRAFEVFRYKPFPHNSPTFEQWISEIEREGGKDEIR